MCPLLPQNVQVSQPSGWVPLAGAGKSRISQPEPPLESPPRKSAQEPRRPGFHPLSGHVGLTKTGTIPADCGCSLALSGLMCPRRQLDLAPSWVDFGDATILRRWPGCGFLKVCQDAPGKAEAARELGRRRQRGHGVRGPAMRLPPSGSSA